ncbi:MAG: two-component system OmpR family response regulator [Planctomycetota bacterium]|jgi:two-component system OmpR family response regulator
MKKILIVEDDPDIAHALGLRLKAADYDVVTAYDAVLGTMAATREQPDLAILDISMPGGDGIMLSERFKENSENAGPPVIFITASKKPEIRERAMAAGAAGFFEKPYDAHEVLQLVHNVLSE